MNLVFSPQAWDDYQYWQETDRKILRRIGKPEPLRHALAGYWSRRITDEHRFVYKPTGNQLLIAQLRFHYE